MTELEIAMEALQKIAGYKMGTQFFTAKKTAKKALETIQQKRTIQRLTKGVEIQVQAPKQAPKPPKSPVEVEQDPKRFYDWLKKLDQSE